MKRVRITYPGAYHHTMNRGYDGNDIFAGNKNKAQFLDFLEGTARKLKYFSSQPLGIVDAAFVNA
jgi:hypothetical protein